MTAWNKTHNALVMFVCARVYNPCILYSEPTKKRPLSPSDDTKSKMLSTESRDRSVRHADVTSGEEEYDAEAHKHLSVDCSVCRRI